MANHTTIHDGMTCAKATMGVHACMTSVTGRENLIPRDVLMHGMGVSLEQRREELEANRPKPVLKLPSLVTKTGGRASIRVTPSLARRAPPITSFFTIRSAAADAVDGCGSPCESRGCDM